ncbi:MAG: ABC transporter ATP-binding protein [Armatimonadota bacterium]
MNSKSSLPAANPAVECRDVRKTFTARQRTVEVLHGASFSVQTGEAVVITGKSGAGKSTLLGLLGGLDIPTTGSVIINGANLSCLPANALAAMRRRQIGIIFQNLNLLPTWTALENVEAALLHTGEAKATRRERAAALLDSLHIGHRLDSLPPEMSAGEQQRVAIARTLINEPTILLADEPTGDVDPETGDEIIARLLSQVKERGVTLIVTTHGNFPLDVTDRVLYLKDGTVVESDAVVKS